MEWEWNKSQKSNYYLKGFISSYSIENSFLPCCSLFCKTFWALDLESAFLSDPMSGSSRSRRAKEAALMKF